nr:hypothetical protein Iba_chr12aCG17790 [Ipomoea batatas]
MISGWQMTEQWRRLKSEWTMTTNTIAFRICFKTKGGHPTPLARNENGLLFQGERGMLSEPPPSGVSSRLVGYGLRHFYYNTYVVLVSLLHSLPHRSPKNGLNQKLHSINGVALFSFGSFVTWGDSVHAVTPPDHGFY